MNISITPNKSTVELTMEYRYKDVVIPIKNKSNGATLSYFYYGVALLGLVDTSFLWLIVISFAVIRTPFYPSGLRASIVHDYLTSKKQYKTADIYYLEILLEDEDKLRAYSKWVGVKIYHFIVRRTRNEYTRSNIR